MKKILSISMLVGGFTMIELLIVISILGILAVAVLSAINPIEQINRGRDTGTKQDAEQLISSTERFAANKGYFPWQTNANSTRNLSTISMVGPDLAIGPDNTTLDATCPILLRLSEGLASNANCQASQELKGAFVARINNLVATPRRALYIYNRGQTGDNTYVCFSPQSTEFQTQARERCTQLATSAPADYPTLASVCPASGNNVAGEAQPMVCLP